MELLKLTETKVENGVEYTVEPDVVYVIGSGSEDYFEAVGEHNVKLELEDGVETVHTTVYGNRSIGLFVAVKDLMQYRADLEPMMQFRYNITVE